MVSQRLIEKGKKSVSATYAPFSTYCCRGRER
jgi:hypothetical protein